MKLPSGPRFARDDRVPYQLRHLDTGAIVRTYDKESAALAFLRDVMRLGSRDAATRFSLTEEGEHGVGRPIAEGAALLRRALADQADA